MKTKFFSIIMGAAFLWSAYGQEALAQNNPKVVSNQKIHTVYVTHPEQGAIAMSVHENAVGARHAESIPREGVTGKVKTKASNPLCPSFSKPGPCN